MSQEQFRQQQAKDADVEDQINFWQSENKEASDDDIEEIVTSPQHPIPEQMQASLVFV
jgi:hypothetical protein